jgi:secreted trypsin-like serine protease
VRPPVQCLHGRRQRRRLCGRDGPGRSPGRLARAGRGGLRGAAPAALLAALAALGACAATGPAETSAAIVNGTSDAGKDPAVVLIRLFTPQGREFALCTGALITPRIVLTAAHCAGDFSFVVDFADSYDIVSKDLTGLLAERAVVGKWVDPQFHESEPASGYDVALLLLDSPAPAAIAPLPIDRTRAVAAGTPMRMVGFGVASASTVGAERNKLTAESHVTRVEVRTFDVDGTSASPCRGDSGGPGLVTIDGLEVVAGVVSFGDDKCAESTSYIIVAQRVADIDAFVQANDPGAFGICGADGTCGFGCTSVDPDCPCAADGACTTACANPDDDPDCPLGCGHDGACVSSGCPTPDPDCASQSGCAIGGGGGGWLVVLVLLGLHRRRHDVRDRRKLA